MPIVVDDALEGTPTAIVLDPVELAGAREELPLNSGAIRVAPDGIDWGDGQVEAYMAELAVGQSPADFRLPNRIITIPLILGANGPEGFDGAREDVQAKAALFQREGGWIRRAAGRYADIVGATLKLPDKYGYLGVETDVILTLEALPDFYGEEIELDPIVEATSPALVAVLQKDGVDAVIEGDYPGRVRIEVDDDAGQRQRGLLGAFRCRHYSDEPTAQLAYAAIELEALDAATVVGADVEHTALDTDWTPVLGTNIGGADWLTHTGTYAVWVKVESDDGDDVQVRWVYDVGDLVFPEENLRRTIPDAGAHYLVYLGQVRLDAPPVGTHRWQGQLQAKGAAGGEHIAARRLYFVPLDESAWKLRALTDGVLASDAVIYANQSAELRTEGFFRYSSDGNGPGQVSDPSGSDLPRIPPSGLEGRPVELFLLTSRGDLATLPDTGVDGKTVRVFYRPSWLFPQS